jgi:hypothetical protein
MQQGAWTAHERWAAPWSEKQLARLLHLPRKVGKMFLENAGKGNVCCKRGDSTELPQWYGRVDFRGVSLCLTEMLIN